MRQRQPLLDPVAELLRKLPAGHARPKSRRDFLAHGLTAGAGFVLTPTLASLLGSSRAYADCAAAPTTSFPWKVIQIEATGGGLFAGHDLVVGLDKQSNLLPVTDTVNPYGTMGLPPAMTPDKAGQVTAAFNMAWQADSSLLRGINAVAAAAFTGKPTTDFRTNMTGGFFAAASQNDDRTQPFNISYLLAKAGFGGTLLPLVGNKSGASGGAYLPAVGSVDFKLKPSTIAAAADCVNLASLGALSTLTPAKQQQVLAAIQKLNSQQFGRSAAVLSPQATDILNCAATAASGMLAKFSPAVLDPTQDPLIASLYTNFNSDAEERALACISHLLFNGYTGAGTVSLGGFDYHDGTAATRETKNLKLGRLIGLAMAHAAAKNQKLIVIVNTDGSVVADPSAAPDATVNGRGKYVSRGDNSFRSVAIMLAFDPAGPVKITRADPQVGAFTAAGAVDPTANVASNDVNKLAVAMFANCLAISGEANIDARIAQILGSNPISKDKLGSVLLWGSAGA